MLIYIDFKVRFYLREVPMRLTTILVAFTALLLSAVDVHSADFDAASDFMCGNQGTEHWSYNAYRVSDGTHRELAYGRVPLDEVSRYGADAFYLPDGGQELRPFFVRLGDVLYCSPAYSGPAYDASLVWTSPSAGKAKLDGYVEFFGKISEHKSPGSVDASLLVDGVTVWTGEAGPDGKVKFTRDADLKKGSKVELRIANGSGDGPKITGVDLHVSTP